MAQDRIRINGTVYRVPSVDDISLRDLVKFNTEAADLGITERWADVEAMLEDGAPENSMLLAAVTVWMARRAAGEDVTFSEAIDIPASSIETVEAPKDRKPKKGTKSRRPSPSTPGSAQETPPLTALSDPSNVETTETSSSQSESA